MSGIIMSIAEPAALAALTTAQLSANIASLSRMSAIVANPASAGGVMLSSYRAELERRA